MKNAKPYQKGEHCEECSAVMGHKHGYMCLDNLCGESSHYNGTGKGTGKGKSTGTGKGKDTGKGKSKGAGKGKDTGKGKSKGTR